MKTKIIEKEYNMNLYGRIAKIEATMASPETRN